MGRSKLENHDRLDTWDPKMGMLIWDKVGAKDSCRILASFGR